MLDDLIRPFYSDSLAHPILKEPSYFSWFAAKSAKVLIEHYVNRCWIMALTICRIPAGKDKGNTDHSLFIRTKVLPIRFDMSP